MESRSRIRTTPYLRKPFYPKRRAPIACEVCRSRKSKCDGATPQCGFCKAISAHCNYVALSERHGEDSSRGNSTDTRFAALEAEVRQLHRSVSILQMKQQLLQSQSSPPAMSWSENDSLNTVINFRSCSIMGNMTAVIDFDVTSYLTDLESETSAVPFLSASTPSLLSKLFDARLMTAFFDQIHQWYPIFDRQSFEAEYLLASTRPVQPSSNSCLFLMVSAIGALALNLENGGAGGNNINEYAAPALQMLHIIMSDHTLIGAQCLIICAIYHLLCFKPIQACQYLTSASYKMQNLYRRNQGRHVVDTELYRRAFYALYIMERQLLVHIDLAGFGISAWQENISLPSGTFENGNTDGETIEFYLAEIAMNKMMERSDQNLSTNLIHQPGELRLPNNSLNRNEFLFANIVAKEIGSQIAEWRRHLPLNIAFPDVGICGSQLSSYLKTQYNALMCGIYWHALYKATIMEDRSPDVVSACQKCLVSFCSFIDSVADLFSKPVLLPQISTTLASVFTISLAVIVVRNEQILKDMGQLEESCARAVEELRRYAVIYPAVGRWADVLASRLDSDK